jgi:hypothetical protein
MQSVIVPSMRPVNAACRMPHAYLRVAWLSVAQGDLVGLGDVVGLDGPQPHAQVLTSLPQQLEGVGGGGSAGRRVPDQPRVPR